MEETGVKTYKRESAWALIIWLMYIVETKDAATINILAWPILTFFGLAYSLDVHSRVTGLFGTKSP
tara:strand:- start:20 stop:217 length:198 start_codon:yes stop_codon:yes gene_type:complete